MSEWRDFVEQLPEHLQPLVDLYQAIGNDEKIVGGLIDFIMLNYTDYDFNCSNIVSSLETVLNIGDCPLYQTDKDGKVTIVKEYVPPDMEEVIDDHESEREVKEAEDD